MKRIQKPLFMDTLLSMSSSKVPAVHVKSLKTAGKRASKVESKRITILAKKVQSVAVPGAALTNPLKNECLWDKKEELKATTIKKQSNRMVHPLTSLPAVELVHPGASYLPDPTAYEEALQKALAIENSRPQKDKITHATPLTEAAFIAHDMDVFDKEHTLDGDIDGDVGEKVPRRAPKRKTKAQRNRVIQEKLKMEACKQQKLRKAIENELSLLQSKKFVRELNQLERSRMEKAVEKKQKILEKMLQTTKKFSKFDFEEPMFPVQLLEDKVDCLRRLAPEGNVLMDRFKNLQKRNLIEVREPSKRSKRLKVRVLERHSYKRFK